MAKDNKINIPGMGGLVRYDEEQDTRFHLKPEHVVVLVIAIILFSISLRIFF
ncbi:MAG: preprotein translocase subunit Sec61beta [Nanoarchaeota archaeon]